MAHMESLWPRLAELPLVVESCEYNEDDPTGELPASPLAPRPVAVGFRWTT